MRRREFISLLGGAAAAWPVVARAQGIERNRRIGVLMASAEADPESRLRVAAFERGLADLCWTTGRNLLIDSLGGCRPCSYANVRRNWLGSSPI
jgi:putative tryptophan/tyrosine transport system substrate-binding protein